MLFSTIESIICRNDELNSTMSWVGCLLKDSELFILFAENSQILLKISVIPILLIFIYLAALNLLVNNQLNSSSNSTHHYGFTAHNCQWSYQLCPCGGTSAPDWHCGSGYAGCTWTSGPSLFELEVLDPGWPIQLRGVLEEYGPSHSYLMCELVFRLISKRNKWKRGYTSIRQ